MGRRPAGVVRGVSRIATASSSAPSPSRESASSRPVRRAVRPPRSPEGSSVDADARVDASRDGPATTRPEGDSHAKTPLGSNSAFAEATRRKEAGNAAFRAGRYRVAASEYDAALAIMRAGGATTTTTSMHGEDEDEGDEGDEEIEVVLGGRDAAVCYATAPRRDSCAPPRVRMPSRTLAVHLRRTPSRTLGRRASRSPIVAPRSSPTPVSIARDFARGRV